VSAHENNFVDDRIVIQCFGSDATGVCCDCTTMRRIRRIRLELFFGVLFLSVPRECKAYVNTRRRAGVTHVLGRVSGGVDNEPLEGSKEIKKHKHPYRAGYYTSIKTQKRIKGASYRGTSSLERACNVIESFTESPPDRCNAANLVCALTLSAKVRDKQTSKRLHSGLYKCFEVLSLLVSQRKTTNKAISLRQLCNAIWAIAKHVDYDPSLLPTRRFDDDFLPIGKAFAVDTSLVDTVQSPAIHLDQLVDQLAEQIAICVSRDDEVKNNELCMACWSLGVLRRRRTPPGWSRAPQVVKLSASQNKRIGMNTVRFETWNDDKVTDFKDQEGSTTMLLDAVAEKLRDGRLDRLRQCNWKEIANVAWAFATIGHCCSQSSESLLLDLTAEATERLQNKVTDQPLSRDLAQIVWALGTLQVDNFHLAASFENLIASIRERTLHTTTLRPLVHWSCPDLIQVCLALAHARLDDQVLLRALFEEILSRMAKSARQRPLSSGRSTFRAWEISILLWVQARLYLTRDQGNVYAEFAQTAIGYIATEMRLNGGLEQVGIRSQEKANLAWSLTVLQLFEHNQTVDVYRRIFHETASSCQIDEGMKVEHANQLWQASFLLRHELPEAVDSIPPWFDTYLEQNWQSEKARSKDSSARHRSLSNCLHLLGVDHYNEHDEDIDVAIVLKPEATWTHETRQGHGGREGLRVAVEFDGPMHFVRQSREEGNDPPRPLGHTVLKYKLLKLQGWTVVRVPFYEFDKIPFWASMERQRYLQRLLKTHGEVRFSDADVSEYQPITGNRGSRYD